MVAHDAGPHLAALALVVWAALLGVNSARAGRTLSFEIVLRPQHYLQACAHLSIFAYWGWYWPVVYESAPMILAQLLFAYGFQRSKCTMRSKL